MRIHADADEDPQHCSQDKRNMIKKALSCLKQFRSIFVVSVSVFSIF
jgi:hypothetical protein